MNWISSIEEFIPSNEQECKDKEVILKYINIFDDILKRDNEIIHITSSGFAINEDKDKVLMVHHNIFNAWSLTGGHADGNDNLLEVAISEVKEETGVNNLVHMTNKIFSLDLLPVFGHFRKGNYVAPHLHASVTYLFQADEKEEITIKPDENSDVKWIPFNDIDICCDEVHMKRIYNKIISKIKRLSL